MSTPSVLPAPAVGPVWDAEPAVARGLRRAHGTARRPSADAALRDADLVVVMGRPAEAEAARSRRPRARHSRSCWRSRPRSTRAGLAGLRAAAAGRFVAVPLPNRLGPAMRECARLRAAGRLGRIGHAHFRLVNGPPERYRVDGVAWMLDPATLGRRRAAQSRHPRRRLRARRSRPARSASSPRTSAAAPRGEAVEDHALVSFEDEAGALFTVEAGYTYASLRPGGDFEWRIAAANATVIDRGDAATVATLDDGARPRPRWPRPPLPRLHARDARLPRAASGRRRSGSTTMPAPWH